MHTESRNALVLGGGGPVGASWMSAVLHGLTSAGVRVAESDVVLGTSAGAVVGSWLTIQPDGLPTVPERMRARAVWHAAKARAGYPHNTPIQRGPGRSANDGNHVDIGAAAATAIPPISAAEAIAMWGANLPEGPWAANLAIVAVNSKTRRARVWSAQDDISLPVAVACSTAAPGIAPPVTVADSVWVDGGVRSIANADMILDRFHDDRARNARPGRVLMLVPLPDPKVACEEAVLVEHGYAVRVVSADPFYATPADLLDVNFVDIAAAAGASQAHELAPHLTTWWSD